MSSILFIAFPLLFGFAVPILNKFGKNAVAYGSTAMQMFLLYLAYVLFTTQSGHVEIISIAPPLGISFVLNKASLLFVGLFTLLINLFSLYYLEYRKTNAFKDENKFFILLNMLFASTIGLVLSSDIFNIYVFFEIAGVSAYILTAYEKNAKALEAGLKYLITGAVASVFLIFAIFLIYIHIGSLNLAVIAQNFGDLSSGIKMLISILLLVGFGFKVEIFPFNFWVSDVYQGSTSIINALFSGLVVKAYIFVFFHIAYLFLPEGNFVLFLGYMGVISMLVAEFTVLRQNHLKRLFAYSSLGQVAMIFMAFALQTPEAVQAAFFVMIAHSIAKFTLFFAITSIHKEHKSYDVDTLKELNSPFLRVVMLISMLSLLGIPIFAGFIGKMLILKSLASNGFILMLILMVFASFIEAIYYFRISGYMFSKGKKREKLKIGFLQKFVFVFLSSLIIIIGIAPFVISGFLQEAANVMLDSQSFINLLGGL